MGSTCPGDLGDLETAGYGVRPAGDADRGVIQEVRRRTWHAAYDHLWGPGAIEQYFDGRIELRGTPQPEGWRTRPWTLVAEHAGQVVGLAAAGVLTGGIGELSMLYVLPEHHGQGAGRLLWDEVVRRLRLAGCHTLQVWVLSRNTPARRFYERRGCRVHLESTCYLGTHAEPETAYRMPL